MLDADGSGQFDPVSRISVHESTKGDGRFDRHSVFVDKLVLPRFVLPLDRRSILTMETNTDDIFKYTDTNGDGVAEKKELLLQRRRPPREPRASAERVRVGARQLDLQHLQRLPHPVDARRDPQGADRAQLRPVGAHAGRQRQDVVRRCRRRKRPDEFSGAHRLRRVQRRRSVRAGLRDDVADARDLGHAGRHAARPDADRRAESLHGGVRSGHLPRRPASRRSARRPAVRRAGRPA